MSQPLKIVQISPVWPNDQGARKPILFGLDSLGKVWMWDWLEKIWFKIEDVNRP